MMGKEATQLEDSDCSNQWTVNAQTQSQGGCTPSNAGMGNRRIINDDSDNASTDDDVGLTQHTVADSEMDMTQDDVAASQTIGDDGIQVGTYSKARTEKDILVAQLLCRWWYVLPDWPPPNYNYRKKLEENKLKCYSVKEFEEHENVDSNGYRKCYQISAFPGVFRDFRGTAHDLRPLDGKPCYNNLIQKSEKELITLIKAAINKQIEILTASQYDETHLINCLREELAELK